MAVLEDLRVKTGELLDEGLKNGALTIEEHSWRRGHLAQASSADELETLVEDLLDTPVNTSTQAVEVQRVSQATILSNRTFSLADLGRRSELVTIMGSTRIDLRGLSPTQPLTLELVSIMGEIVLEVPEGVKVRLESTPVMGDCTIDASLQATDAMVRITGVVVMGSLRVRPSQKHRR